MAKKRKKRQKANTQTLLAAASNEMELSEDAKVIMGSLLYNIRHSLLEEASKWNTHKSVEELPVSAAASRLQIDWALVNTGDDEDRDYCLGSGNGILVADGIAKNIKDVLLDAAVEHVSDGYIVAKDHIVSAIEQLGLSAFYKEEE